MSATGEILTAALRRERNRHARICGARAERRTSGVACAVILLVCWAAPQVAEGGAFDVAIQVANARAVKLYGLGAGVQAGFGTGMLVSEEGHVLTVLSLLVDARRIRAVTADGRLFEAKLLHRDLDQHLALLNLVPWNDSRSEGGWDAVSPAPEGSVDENLASDANAPGPFAYFDLATGEPMGTPSGRANGSATLESGDWVVAAGNAFKVAEGAEPVSITHGVYSTMTALDARRQLRDFSYRGNVLVIDAITCNPGAPGSVVVNLDGWLVGMIGRVVISNLTQTHFNYAIPRDVLQDFVSDGLREGKPDGAAEFLARLKERMRGPGENEGRDFGIRLSRVGYRQVLPFVERVRPDSPAERAGVRPDDLILSVNGRSVSDTDECYERIRELPPDSALDLVIRRGRSIVSIRIAPEAPGE